MEGSTQIRLAAYLETTGTQQKWLARRLDVAPPRLHDWLSGRRAVPDEMRRRIIVVLRARQLERIPTDLFDLEG